MRFVSSVYSSSFSFYSKKLFTRRSFLFSAYFFGYFTGYFSGLGFNNSGLTYPFKNTSAIDSNKFDSSVYSSFLLVFIILFYLFLFFISCIDLILTFEFFC